MREVAGIFAGALVHIGREREVLAALRRSYAACRQHHRFADHIRTRLEHTAHSRSLMTTVAGHLRRPLREDRRSCATPDFRVLRRWRSLEALRSPVPSSFRVREGRMRSKPRPPADCRSFRRGAAELESSVAVLDQKQPSG